MYSLVGEKFTLKIKYLRNGESIFFISLTSVFTLREEKQKQNPKLVVTILLAIEDNDFIIECTLVTHAMEGYRDVSALLDLRSRTYQRNLTAQMLSRCTVSCLL